VLASTLTVRSTSSPPHLQTQVVMTAASLKFGSFAVGAAGIGQLVATRAYALPSWRWPACRWPPCCWVCWPGCSSGRRS
jgi:hypothetical protein